MEDQAFLKWFDDRKIAGLRQEYQEAQIRENDWQAGERKWVEAMPMALKPLWAASKQSFDPDLAPFRNALAQQIPVKMNRILALYGWYGSGSGLWSGFPTYEDVRQEEINYR